MATSFEILQVDATVIAGVLILATFSLFSLSIQDSLLINVIDELRQIDVDLKVNSRFMDINCVPEYQYASIDRFVSHNEFSLKGIPSCDELENTIKQDTITRLHVVEIARDYGVSQNINKDFNRLVFYNKIGPIITIVTSIISITPFMLSAIVEGLQIIGKHDSKASSRGTKLMIVGFFVLLIMMCFLVFSTSCGQFSNLNCPVPK